MPKQTVFSEGKPVENIQEIPKIIHETYKFNFQTADESCDVLDGVKAQNNILHSVTFDGGILQYQMHVPRGEKHGNVSLSALLWGGGNTCRLLRAMQILFGKNITVIPEAQEPSRSELETSRLNGLYLFVWPTSESSPEYYISIQGHKNFG